MESSTTKVDGCTKPRDLLNALISRSEHLHEELKLFQSALRNHGKQHESEIRAFRRGVQSEVKSLQTIHRRTAHQWILDSEDVAEQSQFNYIHALKSSNLPFYEAVWETAKCNSHITGLGRRAYAGSRAEIFSKKARSQPGERSSAVIDIVANNGLKWIKVSTVDNKRLLFEMAKQGWENYGDHSSDEHESSESDLRLNEANKVDDQLELVKVVKTLVVAARAQRVYFQHPAVHLILPNVRESEHDDVDALLQDIRVSGVHLTVGMVTGKGSDNPQTDLSSSNVTALLPTSNSVSEVSQALNVDCTILLAMVSDISHVHQADLPPHPTNRSGTYHKAILKQIDIEKESPLLPCELYGAFVGRELLCTSYAAERMFKIVQTMGTDEEKERAAIFFGHGDYAELTADQLRQRLAELSCHAVPEALNLPVQVVEFKDLSSVHDPSSDLDTLRLTDSDRIRGGRLNVHMPPLDLSIACKLTEKLTLSTINTSVFLYGWAKNITTITSNKAVATNINKTIDEMLDDVERAANQHRDHKQARGVSQSDSERIEFTGPKMYICETARSLIGKEKVEPETCETK